MNVSPKVKDGKRINSASDFGGCQQEAAVDVEWREETRGSFFFVLKGEGSIIF